MRYIGRKDDRTPNAPFAPDGEMWSSVQEWWNNNKQSIQQFFQLYGEGVATSGAFALFMQSKEQQNSGNTDLSKKLMTTEERRAYINQEAQRLGISAPLLESLIAIESKGLPFDNEGYTITRFETHRFFIETNGKYKDYVKFDAANRTKGQFYRTDPKGDWIDPHIDPITEKKTTVAKNPSEIKALQAMARLDENAAYKSASYGIGQILGESYKNLGYNTPKEMFEDFNKGELQQLAGMIKFIETKPKMLPAMRDMDASRIVGGYNGWRKNKDGERYADPNYVSKLQNYYKDLTGKSLK